MYLTVVLYVFCPICHFLYMSFPYICSLICLLPYMFPYMSFAIYVFCPMCLLRYVSFPLYVFCLLCNCVQSHHCNQTIIRGKRHIATPQRPFLLKLSVLGNRCSHGSCMPSSHHCGSSHFGVRPRPCDVDGACNPFWSSFGYLYIYIDIIYVFIYIYIYMNVFWLPIYACLLSCEQLLSQLPIYTYLSYEEKGCPYVWGDMALKAKSVNSLEMIGDAWKQASGRGTLKAWSCKCLLYIRYMSFVYTNVSCI